MPSTPVKSERRKKLRKKPLRLVYVELNFGNGGMMRDLSEEGFAVRAMMPVKQGDKTPFSFTLGEATRIEGEGKILWIDEGGRVAAVQFTQIAPEMKSRIDDWLIEDEKLDSPRGTAREPAIAPASTMEELREEIRSTPVRGEAAAPALGEETRVEHPEDAVRSPLKIEPPKITEPKHLEQSEQISHFEPETRIAAREQIPAKETTKAEVAPKEPPVPAPVVPNSASPKVLNEAASPAVSSVTEGFFGKWPNNAPAPAPAAETDAPDLLSLPLPNHMAAPPKSKSRQIEEEETVEHGDSNPPLPDISDILIQPHGLSPRIETATRPLEEIPAPGQTGLINWEWFTLRRAILTMVVLMILVGGIVFHRVVGNGLIWLGEAMGGTSSSSSNLPSTDNASPNPSSPANTARTPTIPSTSAANGTPSFASTPKNPSATVTPFATPEASPDSGQSEYLQAVQLMRGRSAGVDLPEAVRLLWIAVEKGNPSAEVMLADLYWRGQGVVHNCDQARILLMAAVRKGSSEAQKRLQQFQREGCE